MMRVSGPGFAQLCPETQMCLGNPLFSHCKGFNSEGGTKHWGDFKQGHVKVNIYNHTQNNNNTQLLKTPPHAVTFDCAVYCVYTAIDQIQLDIVWCESCVY